MKNADVIRQMTDDELYRFLGAFEVGDIDYALTSCNWCGEEIDCATCFRRWLFGDANDYKGLLADKGINSGYADRKTENSSEIPNNSTISKMEQVDEPQYDAEDQFCIEHNCPHFYQFGGCMNQGDCPYDEDEPQTNADQHVQHVGSVESVEPTWTKEEHEAFYTFLWNVINPNEMQDYIEMFETKDEPQTCSVNGRPYDCGNCEYFRCTADEPQTNKEIVLDPSFAELSDEQFVEAMKLIEPQTDCPWK